MLVLGREEQQQILIFKDGGDAEDAVCITVMKIHGKRVRIGIEAAEHMKIVRKELLTNERNT